MIHRLPITPHRRKPQNVVWDFEGFQCKIILIVMLLRFVFTITMVTMVNLIFVTQINNTFNNVFEDCARTCLGHGTFLLTSHALQTLCCKVEQVPFCSVINGKETSWLWSVYNKMNETIHYVVGGLMFIFWYSIYYSG